MGTHGVWRALKTIFPNEKVYDNYGRHYHVEDKNTRQQMLAAQYFFDCNCSACKEDWPVYRVSFTIKHNKTFLIQEIYIFLFPNSIRTRQCLTIELARRNFTDP